MLSIMNDVHLLGAGNRKELVDRGQPFLVFQIWLQCEFLPILVPLLQPVVILADEVRANFVVEHTLNRDLPILDGQSHNDFAHVFDVVVDHAGGRDCVFNELVIDEVANLQIVDVVVESLGGFLNVEQRATAQPVEVVELRSPLKYANGQCQILIVGLFHALVLLIVFGDLREVSVDEERTVLPVEAEECLFLLLEVDRLDFLQVYFVVLLLPLLLLLLLRSPFHDGLHR